MFFAQSYILMRIKYVLSRFFNKVQKLPMMGAKWQIFVLFGKKSSGHFFKNKTLELLINCSKTWDSCSESFLTLLCLENSCFGRYGKLVVKIHWFLPLLVIFCLSVDILWPCFILSNIMVYS